MSLANGFEVSVEDKFRVDNVQLLTRQETVFFHSYILVLILYVGGVKKVIRVSNHIENRKCLW